MPIFCKVHDVQGQSVLACAEKRLVGKTLEEAGLKLKIRESFYKEKEVGEKELEELLEECTSANLVGEMPLKAAESKGLIKREQAKYIGGVPFIQIYKV